MIRVRRRGSSKRAYRKQLSAVWALWSGQLLVCLLLDQTYVVVGAFWASSSPSRYPAIDWATVGVSCALCKLCLGSSLGPSSHASLSLPTHAQHEFVVRISSLLPTE